MHCLAGTKGAGFPENLHKDKIHLIVKKGTHNSDDGYSAFEASNISLNKYLKDQYVDKLYICGLTTEYCVKNTVLDALKEGYKTFVVKDAVEGVKAQPGDEDNAWQEMKNAGAKLIYSKDIS